MALLKRAIESESFTLNRHNERIGVQLLGEPLQADHPKCLPNLRTN